VNAHKMRTSKWHLEPGKCSQYSDSYMGWTVQGSIPGRCKRFISPSKSPTWLWSQPTLQWVWHWGCVMGSKSAEV